MKNCPSQDQSPLFFLEKKESGKSDRVKGNDFFYRDGWPASGRIVSFFSNTLLSVGPIALYRLCVCVESRDRNRLRQEKRSTLFPLFFS